MTVEQSLHSRQKRITVKAMQNWQLMPALHSARHSGSGTTFVLKSSFLWLERGTRKPSCRWQTHATQRHDKNCSNSAIRRENKLQTRRLVWSNGNPVFSN